MINLILAKCRIFSFFKCIRRQKFVCKFLEDVVSQMFQFLHDTAYVFLLGLKMLAPPLECHQFASINWGLYHVVIKTRLTLSRNLSWDIRAWHTIFTRPHITHLERKNSRPDISTLTAYEITLIAILKHVFQETKHEELYMRIIILKLNA